MKRPRGTWLQQQGTYVPKVPRVVKVEVGTDRGALFHVGIPEPAGMHRGGKVAFTYFNAALNDFGQVEFSRSRFTRRLAHTYSYACTYMREESHPPWWFAAERQLVVRKI